MFDRLTTKEWEAELASMMEDDWGPPTLPEPDDTPLYLKVIEAVVTAFVVLLPPGILLLSHWLATL